jgi:hypothetical protein
MNKNQAVMRYLTLILGTRTAEFFLDGRELALAEEGLVALVFESQFPVANQIVLKAERAGSLGDGVACSVTSLTASALNSAV